VGPEFALAEQVENVVRIVQPLLAEPVVAVVPPADLIPVQSFQFREEHCVQVAVRISADGRIPRRQADVHEVVETRGKTGLREHRDAGDEDKPDMVLGILKDAVQIAQAVSICPGPLRVLQYIKNRPVVFVDQYHRLSACFTMQLIQDMTESLGSGCYGRGMQVKCLFDPVQLTQYIIFQVLRRTDVSAEAQADHRMPDRPVPVRVDVESPEQRLVALEQLLQGTDQQTLAKAAGAGEKVEPSLPDHLPDQGRLVDIVAALAPEIGERLIADR